MISNWRRITVYDVWDWDDHQHLLSLTIQKKPLKDHPGAAALNSKVNAIILLSHLVKKQNAFAMKPFHPTEYLFLGSTLCTLTACPVLPMGQLTCQEISLILEKDCWKNTLGQP